MNEKISKLQGSQGRSLNWYHVGVMDMGLVISIYICCELLPGLGYQGRIGFNESMNVNQ